MVRRQIPVKRGDFELNGFELHGVFLAASRVKGDSLVTDLSRDGPKWEIRTAVSCQIVTEKSSRQEEHTLLIYNMDFR